MQICYQRTCLYSNMDRISHIIQCWSLSYYATYCKQSIIWQTCAYDKRYPTESNFNQSWLAIRLANQLGIKARMSHSARSHSDCFCDYDQMTSYMCLITEILLYSSTVVYTSVINITDTSKRQLAIFSQENAKSQIILILS